VKNTPEEAKYHSMKWLIDDTEGFGYTEIIDGKLDIQDAALAAILEVRGWTEEMENRYIKERLEKS
jgi:hypothetical protein